MAAGFSRESVESGGRFVWAESMQGSAALTHEREPQLLAKLARGWSIKAACKAAGINRQTYYNWRAADPAFADRADQAIEDGTDELEDSSTRQAFQGNTTLMVLLLKARRPEKYREIREERHTGKDGGPIRFAGVNIPPPTADEESP